MTRAALTLLALGIGGVAALGAAFYGLLRLLRHNGGFWGEAWRVLFGVPPSLERWLMAAAVLLAVAALCLTPLALLERRSRKAFDAKAAELRAARPEDVVVPYEGAEGEGLAFDGPQGRLVLLRGRNGVGDPEVVQPATPDDAA